MLTILEEDGRIELEEAVGEETVTFTASGVELNNHRGVFARTHNDHLVFITDSNEVMQIPEKLLDQLYRVSCFL